MIIPPIVWEILKYFSDMKLSRGLIDSSNLAVIIWMFYHMYEKGKISKNSLKEFLLLMLKNSNPSVRKAAAKFLNSYDFDLNAQESAEVERVLVERISKEPEEQFEEGPYSSASLYPTNRRALIFSLAVLGSLGPMAWATIEKEDQEKDYLSESKRKGVGAEAQEFIRALSVDPDIKALHFEYEVYAKEQEWTKERTNMLLSLLSWLKNNGSEEIKRKINYIFNLIKERKLKISFNIGVHPAVDTNRFQYNLSPGLLSITFHESMVDFNKLDMFVGALISTFAFVYHKRMDHSKAKRQVMKDEIEEINHMLQTLTKQKYPNYYDALVERYNYLKNEYDSSMVTKVDKSGPGGIDLTSDKALTVQNNGQGIKFHLDPAQLAQLQNAPGFVPVIINIQPLKSLPEFLGINQSQAVVHLAAST
jgi:hypothetical protein